MSGPATLRSAGIDDIGAVMTVMTAAFDPAYGEAWNRGQCLGILTLPDVWLSLAFTGPETEGAAGFALSRLLVDEVELLLLAVDPAQRRRGIGRALLDRELAAAATRGARRLLLEMREGNPAIALYRSAGFGEIGRRRGYYRGLHGALFDAITLARPIASGALP